MANLSHLKRQRMLAFLDTIRQEHKDDDDVLIALGEIESELNAKKYGLVWEQHEEAVDVKMRTHIPVFTEDAGKEITCDESGVYNFLLEGDNLHSLRLLEKTHSGKVDMIYIDPPYNTGNKDFIYDDACVSSDDGYFHSKWLSFMAERLQIAKSLLSDNGIILISIDETEYSNLKLLCDDIFGERNAMGSFIWKSRQVVDSRNKTHISNDHEYILVFAKNIENASILGKEVSQEKYSNPDNDPRGPWMSNSILGLANAEQRPNLHYDLIDPKTGIVYPCNPSTGWRFSKETMAQKIAEGRILFPAKKSGRPREKKFYNEISSKFTGLSTVLPETVGYTLNGSREITQILGNRAFDFPKPVSLIQFLVAQCLNKNAVILDFFAGSGTTAHAVLKQNLEDGGNRRFILCTNNENHICEEVTYERIRRVIDGYGDVAGIPANLKYYRTDFVARDEEYLSDALLEHIAEMIQLEHGIKIDGQRYIMVMSDEEADELEQHWNEYTDVQAMYVSKNVLFTAAQVACFKETPQFIIPDNYFKFELREEGEVW